MSWQIRLYIASAVTLAIGTTCLWTAVDPPAATWPWTRAVIILVACVVLERRAAQMPGGNIVSIATIPHLAGVFLLPPPLAIIPAAIGIFIELVRLRQPWSRVVFNTANTTITVGVAALVARLLDVHDFALIKGGINDVLGFFVVIVVYYLLNSLLLAGVMALSRGENIWRVFWVSAKSSAPAEVAVSVIGGLAVFVWLSNAMWLPVVLFPMLIAQLTLDYLAATDRKTRELEHQAYHDALTGLANRAALDRSLARAFNLESARSEQAQAPTGLLMLDLDGFKEVNDTFGHQHGDAVLSQVPVRLQNCIGDRGEVARLGGDEFAVVLYGADALDAERLAQEVHASLSVPIRAADLELFMAGSIGVAISPADAADPETLLRHADVAMYAAKQTRSVIRRYSPEMDSDHKEQLMLLHDFRVALADGSLSLAYQPKISMERGELHSVEALLRWNDPQRGPVSPAVFVPLAEQAGLSGAILRWVLDAALSQCRTWNDRGRAIPMCVNISMYDLRDPDFPDLIIEKLKAHGVPATLLTIELTESAAMADPQRTRIVLERLRTLGVKVSVDDFGTGYSSLAYLVGLPVDELKIDRSFVLGMQLSAQHVTVVRSTISLGHDLNLTVVAEGVEDQATSNRLRAFGCDLIQGYLLSRPLPAAELLRWIDRRETVDSALAA